MEYRRGIYLSTQGRLRSVKGSTALDDQEWLNQLERRIREIEGQQRADERYAHLLCRVEQIEKQLAATDGDVGIAAGPGRMLYWTGCIGAWLMVLLGLTAMSDNRDFGLLIVFAILASAFWSVGKGLRYILSGSC
jgi:hypothetical protein